MPVTGKGMAGFWGKKKNDKDTGVSADFQRALMQEVMTTELLRATAGVLGVICSDAVSLGEVEARGYERSMAVWQLG
jgi:adenylate cyclase